jgi:hypothetical protein
MAVDDNVSGDEDSVISGNVLSDNGNGADSDADGNLDPNSVTEVSSPTDGTLSLNSDGSFNYTPNPEFNGVDSFVYQVCDSLGLCDTATATITVNPVADLPAANDDSASTAEDTLVTIDVADNDSDPDGDLDPASANTTCATCSGPGNGTLINNADGTFDYTPFSGFTGEDSFVYEICDLSDLCDTASVAIIVNPSAPVTIEVRVAASSDDAEEKQTGRVSLTSSDLELVFDKEIQIVGIRFNGVAIPQDANIINAYVQFQVDETHSEVAALTIRGEVNDNAPTFVNSTNNIRNRAMTMASVSWAPEPWATRGEAGPDQQTPDIATVIQEIVDRPGWVSGNSLVIIITGTGKRVAESYNGDQSGAPLLHVEYVE